MLQFAPAARLVPQLFANANEEAFVPVTVMPEMDNVRAPELVKVTDCDALVEPTFTEPNERLAADSFAIGAARPVPLSAIDCGEPLALSVMVMAAGREPVAMGLKCPWMLQFAPAARLVPQLFENAYEEAFAPVTAMLAIDNVALPVLVRVTD